MQKEPKNIVLLSDGTGNTSATLFTTNVWQLYQALDLSDPGRQVAYYDDGVGTSGFKPWRILGGVVFGYGLKRNVIDIYSFLCRNYQYAGEFKPDHHIFGFGFSRGAFTMRVVAGMLDKFGLVPYDGNEAQLALDATSIYKLYRREFHTKIGFMEWLRDKFFIKFFSKPDEPKGRSGPAKIHFLGLWDTVEAYGGPIQEIPHAIDYWISPLLILKEKLPDNVLRACHALALDDERPAFRPMLWDEFIDKNDPQPIGAIPNDEVTKLEGKLGKKLPDIDRQKLSQVWFAGVHSDIGGGYSQDGLSYVTLDWMMDRAEPYGLRLKPDEEKRLRSCANKFDKLNDSRRGLGAYYRYKPRRFATLVEPDYFPFCARLIDRVREQGMGAGFRLVIRLVTGGPAEEKRASKPQPVAIIHESVFDRIKQGVNAYAPIGLPETYWWTDKDGGIHKEPYPPANDPGMAHSGPGKMTAQGDGEIGENDGERKLTEQDRIWNLVWYRRVVYFIFATGSAVLIALSLKLFNWPVTWLGAVADIVLFLFSVWCLRWCSQKSSSLQQSIGDLMRQLWMKRLDLHFGDNKSSPAPWPANSVCVRNLRNTPWYREVFSAFSTCIFQTLLVFGSIPLLVGCIIGGWVCWLILGVCVLFTLAVLFLSIVSARRDDLPARRG